jgi:hypothetical protein
MVTFWKRPSVLMPFSGEVMPTLIVVLNARVGEDGWMIETVAGGEAAFTEIDGPTRLVISARMVEEMRRGIRVMTGKANEERRC